MKPEDLTIGESAEAFVVTATGRANFEYAVPVRELIGSIDGTKLIRVELKNCTAMDSTFMGVLTMGALKAAEHDQTFEICNASGTLKKLLTDLGVSELFTFRDGVETAVDSNVAAAAGGASKLTTAETVAEAHKKLVEADAGNAAKFDAVIRFAEEDVKHLKEQK